MSKIMVCGWYITVLVNKRYMKVTKVSEIEISGKQTVIYENLVYMKYTQKSCIKSYYNLFLLCALQPLLLPNSGTCKVQIFSLLVVGISNIGFHNDDIFGAFNAVLVNAIHMVSLDTTLVCTNVTNLEFCQKSSIFILNIT